MVVMVDSGLLKTLDLTVILFLGRRDREREREIE